MRGGGFRLIILLLYLVFGLYFLNYPFGIITLPESLSNVDSWIIFIGGIMILFGGINYFRTRRYAY